MKTVLAGLWISIAVLGFMSGPLQGAPREAQWKKVDEAVSKGLPKTAIEELDPIIQGAMRDRAYGEAAKAISRKIVLEGNIQGNKPEEKITRMEAEIAEAPREMKPLLETILANWYWHYFQNNRWRFMQRTATAQAPGKDFTTWDLPRLFTEIDKHFQAALAGADVLKKTPVTAYDDLLEKGAMPDAYRPTLYDFIAHEALLFYTSGEQAAAKPQDAFEVSAETPIFAAAENYMEWRPETTDTDSPVLKAIQLYQELLKFHQKDQDPSAFIDADLDRLKYANNIAFGEVKGTRYKEALKRIVDKWADHPLSAMALVRWAEVVKAEGDWVEARKLAERGAKVFPESAGGKLCQNFVLQIDAKSLNISTERVWNQPLPKIQVRYRNLTEVHFRAIAQDWSQFLQKKFNRPENLSSKELTELLTKAPTLAWSAKLPPTPDFKEHLEQLPAPADLKPGFYVLIASHDPKFGVDDNQLSYTDVWVSELALVVRTHSGKVEGFVLEANSGEPVPGAEVDSWYLDNQGSRVANPHVKTDENGFFAITTKQIGRGFLLRARHNGREISSQQEYSAWNPEPPHPDDRTIFFTDRAIYRPGQMIQYKGICLHVDQERNNYKLLPGTSLTVVFNDPNGKEIEKRTHRCNEYGSFSGTFTAPRDRVMGHMHIMVHGGPLGSGYFNVEEYKRPKFQVTLDAPKTAAKLNEKVSLVGHATSYTGAAVDGAQVKYRIVREVRYPYWWGWYSWRTPRQQGSQEIAHGKLQTDAGGSFTLEFVAKPDPTVLEKDEPTFYYQVYADVTDTAGETRSAQRGVRVGYTALQATLSAKDWQTEDNAVEIKLQTSTLDGEGQTAEGGIKIYRLKEPAQVQRPPLAPDRYYGQRGAIEPPEDLSNPNSWELADVVTEKGWTTDAQGALTLQFKLSAGVYRAMLETQDRFGKKVTGRLPIHVLKPDAVKLGVKIPHLLAAPTWTVEPGQEFMALWGTGYESGRAFVEIEHRNQMIQRYWTRPGQTQQQLKVAVEESMRGGFTVHVTQVRENRAYLDSRRIDVPWSNKDLDISWEHFTSKLQPNQKETWTAVITGPKAEKAVAEMVATLYDESLDAFRHHHWPEKFNIFRQDYTSVHAQFENRPKAFQVFKGQWNQRYLNVPLTYRHFPRDLVANFWGYQFARRGQMRAFGADMPENAMVLNAAPAPATATPAEAKMAGAALMDMAGGRADTRAANAEPGQAPAPSPAPDLSQVTARKNLNETAFFFPHLISDASGVVKLQFSMPEALTKWKFYGFAYDKELRSGFIRSNAVTAKDLMVQPNPPRFLREGDELEFTVKVSNQTAARQTGKVRLTFNDAMTEQSVDALLANKKTELDFDIPAKESRSYGWKIKVPDGMGFLTYKAVGATGKVSDGEEGFVPVLSRYIFVTESLPLPIRGPGTKKFEFTKLLKSGKSDTLRHQGLTVHMVSNPSWYAVMALPYLMEYPYECSEQIFNRLYANSLARYIANSDPKIHRIFELWRNTPALDSPMEKNQDLKSVMIEETPWLRQAQSESQARRNVGLLFEDNRMNSEIERTFRKLAEMQLPDGAWPWFPGGLGNDYITLYITTGFGRMRHLGAEMDMQPAIRSLDRLDGWIDRRYREILERGHKDENHLTETISFYLYGRSFFLKDHAVRREYRDAVEYFLGQARTYWLQLANRQSHGHLALALKRFNLASAKNDSTPTDIMKSIKERSVTDEELGMFWRELELSWWWYRAPIETQALMIEAFDEVMNDTQAVEDCQVWLLKQKQTQDWKTTKATADAVYGLLLRGRDKLASDALVEMTVGGNNITPKRGTGMQPAIEGRNNRQPAPAVEPGTGFYEMRFTPNQIKPKLGEITLRKVDTGVAWGSVHWQYLEDMSKVTPYEGTPLKLKKSLYTKTATNKGQVLEPVRKEAKVGDELVVRIELRVDRDMEYVHLKDQRGSGTEPVNVLSHYKFQDGLAYYESTRDTASHFFIDYLPKGVYVFEYSVRVQHRGQYQTGMAEIQCMYAPEFNSHSESYNLRIN